jgi:hypothetical protein
LRKDGLSEQFPSLPSRGIFCVRISKRQLEIAAACRKCLADFAIFFAFEKALLYIFGFAVGSWLRILNTLLPRRPLEWCAALQAGMPG